MLFYVLVVVVIVVRVKRGALYLRLSLQKAVKNEHLLLNL